MSVRTAAAMTVVAVALAGCTADDRAGEPSSPAVIDPFVGQATAGSAAALYFTLTQEGGDDRLVGVSTEVSDVVGVMTADMAMDDALTDRSVNVPLPAGETVEFAPGGDHLMVIDVSRDLDPGDNVAVTLVFERHGEVTVQAPTLSLLDINERVADRRDAEGGGE